MLLPLLLAAHVAAAVEVPPPVKIAGWAVLRGVAPVVALAVSEAETGALPEAKRDRVVSRGNVGRLQINATTWCRRLGFAGKARRAACIRSLKVPGFNARTGTGILAGFQAAYAPRGAPLVDVAGCRCGRAHAGGWTAHWNEGLRVSAGGRGERFGLRVQWHVSRLVPAVDRRW